MNGSRELRLFVDARYASPYAMSAYAALREKRLEFAIQTVDLAAHENQLGDYVQASLTQRVPTLIDGEFSLSESSAITEYLDDVFGGPRLYPAEPRQRARARQLQAWLRSDLLALRQDRPTEVMFYGPVATPLSAAGKAAALRLFAAADRLLAHGGPYLFDDWSIVDVDLATMLCRLVLNGDPVPGMLAAYAQRQWQRPSLQEWIGLPRPPL
ncbi:MAG: glutathione transferase [Lautropia sp.]